MTGTIGNEVLYVKKISISTILFASEKEEKGRKVMPCEFI
jgi:hypothetical protein